MSNLDRSFGSSQDLFRNVSDAFEKVIRTCRTQLVATIKIWDRSALPIRDTMIPNIERIDELLSRIMSLFIVSRQKAFSGDSTDEEITNMLKEITVIINMMNVAVENLFLMHFGAANSAVELETSLNKLTFALTNYPPALGIWNNLRDTLDDSEN